MHPFCPYPSIFGPIIPSICTNNVWLLFAFTTTTLLAVFTTEAGKKLHHLVKDKLLDQAEFINSPLYSLRTPHIVDSLSKDCTTVFTRVFVKKVRCELGEGYAVISGMLQWSLHEGEYISL